MLASIEPRGGEPGQVTPPLEDQPSEELIDTNAFRGGLALARSISDAWPWFVLTGCCLFLADVFVRRVAINFDWIGKAITKVRGGQRQETQVTARLDALKKNKEALDDSLQRRRASVRFEPTEVDVSAADEIDLDHVSAAPKAKTTEAPKSEEQGPSYTERLLEAKRKARKN